ncbi:MAG: hypothetical protein WCK17_03525, partial [Verrucomicrobiota bacterium]
DALGSKEFGLIAFGETSEKKKDAWGEIKERIDNGYKLANSDPINNSAAKKFLLELHEIFLPKAAPKPH